jgi:hypothetical protein
MITADGTKIQNGYKLRGLEPPDLASYDASTRKLFWSWVLEFGLKRKDKELSQGLDKDGEPLKPIDKYTREHRRSAMTPSGKGDPGAPPLTPGLQKSRTRSLLAGRAFSTHAEFYWRYDSFTGASWAVVLSYQAVQGRDVFGLSDAGMAWVKVQAWALWDQWKTGHVRQVSAATKAAKPAAIPRRPVQQPGETKIINQGRKPTEAATYGIGADAPRKGHGGRTPAEWDAYFRQTASATLPGRPANPGSKSDIVGPKYNRIIRQTWNQAQPGSNDRPPPSMARQRPAPVAGPAKADFVTLVLQAIANVPASKRYNSSKVWIHDVWTEYLKLKGAVQMSLEAFKAAAVEELALRMRMARADLVQAMNPADVAASDTHYKMGSRTLATFNFFKV